MSLAGRHVVVIGGGVIGTACAHYLTHAGVRVTIIDQGEFASGASHGNCGLVCPSHVLPLAEPGAITATLRAMLRPNSPFSIRPRLDPALWSWLLRFASRCNREDMLAAGRGIQALLNSSRALYEDLISSESLACEWEHQGLLYVYRDPREWEAYAPTERLLREVFDAPGERLDSRAVVEREPSLKPDVAGGWYYHEDAHLRPDRLMRSWRSALESRGVAIREHHRLVGFRADGGRASAAQTEAAEIEGDCFVVATGAWTPMLNRLLGCRLPIQPGKGYSLTMSRPRTCPRIPMIFPETRVAVTPFASGYRLGSTMEFAGYDATINPRRIQLLRDGAAPYLREPVGEHVEEQWTGWRPMTFDSLPIIDRSPAHGNVWIAAGHNMLGLSMAPASGKLVAELLTEQSPHLDPRPYRLDRHHSGARP